MHLNIVNTIWCIKSMRKVMRLFLSYKLFFFQSKRRQKESKLSKKLAFESTIPQALEMVGGSERDPGCMMDNTGSGSIKGK